MTSRASVAKRSNPTRNVPHAAPFGGGASTECVAARTSPDRARAAWPAAHARSADWERDTMKRGRIETNNGDTMPDRAPTPRPPPLLVLYQDLEDSPAPEPVYGQYPRGLIKKML